MPEISGPGQKKLLESRVELYCESVKSLESVVYYLAACGIGHINCYVGETEGCEPLVKNINDLNNDVSFKINHFKSINKLSEPKDLRDNSFIFRIILGDYESFPGYWRYLRNESDSNFVFTILACINNWSGAIQACDNREKLDFIISSIVQRCSKTSNKSMNEINESESSILTKCVLGSIAVIEGIKSALNIGKLNEEALYINLQSLEIKRVSAEELDVNLDNLILNNMESISVYSEKTLPGKINKAKVLIVGAGGLGSPAAYALAAVGIGTLGLVDCDTVEISNLNRQILHTTSRIGMPKVKSAEEFIKKLNPNVEVITYNTRFTEDNAQELISNYDLVIDAVDNLTSRYVLNRACQSAKKPFIEAGVVRFYGQCMTFIPGNGPCYSCIFPNEEALRNTMTCAEAGVLGVMPGLIGFMQAAEAIKVITDKGNTIEGKILFFDAIDSEFSIFNFNKNPRCVICGIKEGV